MKKRIMVFLFAMLFVSSVILLAACGSDEDISNPSQNLNQNENQDTKKDFTGITFSDVTETYDGTEKSIAVSGLPDGAEVIYSAQTSYKDCGTYAISATVKKDGYNDLTLEGKLVITPCEIDIEWSDIGPFAANGEAPEIEYTVIGEVEGESAEIEISFGECDFTEVGSFTFSVNAKNFNYKLKDEDKSLEFTVISSEHTVTFDSGVLGEEDDIKTVDHNEPVSKPRRDPTRRGYEFAGWYYGDEEWNFDNPVTENMTLSAKWNAIEYNITYFLNGGVNSPENPSTFTLETEKQLTSPTKEGCVFLGWFEDSSFTTPANAIGTSRMDISLYAKWSEDSFCDLVSEETLDSEKNLLAFSEPGINGSFKYVFAADIDSFGADGAIYVGRGFDSVDGSYIKIASNKIYSYVNGLDGDQTFEFSSHSRNMTGYVVITVEAVGGKATVRVHTSNGATEVGDLLFEGRHGEIFAKAENAALKNVSFAWYTDAYEHPTWFIGDEAVYGNNNTSYTYQLINNNYVDISTIGANGLNSSAALELFRAALVRSVPEYAVFSFGKDDADTAESIRAFAELCREYSITPVFVTQPEAFDEDNAALNAEIAVCGERVIDLCKMAAREGTVSEGKYTELGAKLLYTQVLVDFLEITKGAEALRYTEASWLSGSEDDRLTLSGNTIKDGKYLVFTARLDNIAPDGKIVVGHGYMTYNGAWVEIGADSFTLYNYYSYTNPKLIPVVNAEAHGLEIKNFITVILAADHDRGGSTMTIATDGGFYSYNFIGAQSGNDGDMTAFSIGTKLNESKLSWTCVDISKDIWIFGDSYLGYTNSARWPYYMYLDGYQNSLMVGYAGMASKKALADLKYAIQYSTPKYIVWCMGMNDGDKNDTINSSYYECVMEVLAICEERGIIPVISTIPTCLAVDNSVKNYYINNKEEGFSSYDYLIVDFARAVNGYVAKEDATWYDDMLYQDNVHPAVIGAKALYMQFVADFPEIMGGWNVVVQRAEEYELGVGESITIDCPDEIKYNKFYTFSADYSDSLMGTIEIGNDKKTEGATWIKIDSQNVTVYQNIGGEAVEILKTEHNALMRDIINVKIHVKGSVAKISMMAAGEKYSGEPEKKVFSFEAEWSFAGDVFAKAVGSELENVSLSFFTAD